MVDIYDPDGYVNGPPHDVFAELRRTDPVHWQDMPDGTGYWAVLRHADLIHVARHPEVFSASEGGVVLEDLAPDQLVMMRHMLLAMDPPEHEARRQPLAPNFTARVIGEMEGRIRSICGSVIDEARERGDIDFVHDVAARIPSQVVGELMGLPPEDWPKIHRWAEQQTSGQDPSMVSAENPSMAMAMYAIELAARRRSEPPREDLTSLILAQPMTDVDFGSFFVQLVTAGNDTTKTMLSSGLLALLDHPEQLQMLRSDRHAIPGAVEEILRWANPLHYFRRTAMQDSEVAGTKITAGDKVAMLYTSANRDEAVFTDPQAFDVRRDPNPHLSFGIGVHFCLGAHLARLEGRVFFDELFDRVRAIEQTGAPVRIRSNLNNGLRLLPVHLL
jgi:cytochrome P450